MVSDSESEYSQYSDTEREGIDAKNIIKNKFMSHTCLDCCKTKSLIKQGFVSDVSGIICEYIECENCSNVSKTIDKSTIEILILILETQMLMNT